MKGSTLKVCQATSGAFFDCSCKKNRFLPHKYQWPPGWHFRRPRIPFLILHFSVLLGFTAAKLPIFQGYVIVVVLGSVIYNAVRFWMHDEFPQLCLKHPVHLQLRWMWHQNVVVLNGTYRLSDMSHVSSETTEHASNVDTNRNMSYLQHTSTINSIKQTTQSHCIITCKNTYTPCI